MTYAELEKEFGKAVADGVMALTKNETLASKQEQMLDSLERIKQQPKVVWAVKMADRISNLGEPPHYWKKEKRQKYQNEAKVILEHLGEANKLLAMRLQEKIDNYSKYI
jgi:(p)ppGpp synthase/HD superfamily hydrolase